MKGLRAAILMAMVAVPATASPRHGPDLTLVGSYGAAESEAMILERGGALYLARGGAPAIRLVATGPQRYRADRSTVIAERDGIVVDGRALRRHDFGAETEAAMRAAVRR